MLNKEGKVTGQAREISRKCSAGKLSLSTPDDLEAERTKRIVDPSCVGRCH